MRSCQFNWTIFVDFSLTGSTALKCGVIIGMMNYEMKDLMTPLEIILSIAVIGVSVLLILVFKQKWKLTRRFQGVFDYE